MVGGMSRRRGIAAVGIVGAAVALVPGQQVRPSGAAHHVVTHDTSPEVSRSTIVAVPPGPDTSVPTAAWTGPPPVRAAGPVDLGTFRATCYDLAGTTASGAPAGPGSIAVDPSVIPLGTHLHVTGYGDGIASDTGGAIVGNRIDLWESTDAECMTFGVRWVDVEEVAA